MNLFTIFAAVWRHKRVSIPIILLIVAGVFYVGVIKASVYQAQADVVLTTPPAPPTAMEIAQDPKLARASNPYASLGAPLYVAEVMAQLVTAPAAQQALEKAGAAPGYGVALVNAASTNTPPALAITGVGSSVQAAIRSAALVAGAISHDLNQLQASQHVQSRFMITAVEYVTPTTATVSSSATFQLAAGVIVIGGIVLLVAVSAADGLEERKKRRPHSGKRPGSHTDAAREPAGSAVPAQQHAEQSHAQYAEPRTRYSEPPQVMDAHAASPRWPGPAPRPGMQSAVGIHRPRD